MRPVGTFPVLNFSFAPMSRWRGTGARQEPVPLTLAPSAPLVGPSAPLISPSALLVVPNVPVFSSSATLASPLRAKTNPVHQRGAPSFFWHFQPCRPRKKACDAGNRAAFGTAQSPLISVDRVIPVTAATVIKNNIGKRI